MKKRLLSVIMAMLLVGSMLTACSKETKQEEKPGTEATKAPTAEATKAPVDTSEPVTLTVWESVDGPDEFIKKAGEAFTAKNPNITIEYVNVELGDSTSQIALDGPAGVGPDLFAAPHDKLGELVSGGHVLATNNADAVKSQVLGACSTALTYDGTMYGYPISAETYALFYNKALISEDKVPTT